MSEQYKLNLIILLLDMKECFPSMTKRICGWLLKWFGLPDDVVARYLEFNDSNFAVMMEFKAISMSKQSPVAADFANLWTWVTDNTIHFQSLGTTQGYNSSLTLVGMCLRSLTHQWEVAGKGFAWPLDDIEMSNCIPMPRPLADGVGYIDDGSALAGGGSTVCRMSVDQTISNMMHIAMICTVWARYFVPMGHGKINVKLLEIFSMQLGRRSKFKSNSQYIHAMASSTSHYSQFQMVFNCWELQLGVMNHTRRTSLGSMKEKCCLKYGYRTITSVDKSSQAFILTLFWACENISVAKQLCRRN